MGFFRIAVLGVGLLEGNRREFGIGTHGPDHHEFCHAKEPGLLHQLQPHDGIVIEKLARMLAIGAATPPPRPPGELLGLASPVQTG
jgi:hypothetical protein